MNAGADLCHSGRVEVLVTEGPQRIRELMEIGVKFHAPRRESGSW